AEQTQAYGSHHEVHNPASYGAATAAWLRLRAGEWDEAERIAQREVQRRLSGPPLLAKNVVAAAASPRGARARGGRPPEGSAAAAAQGGRAGELQRTAPVVELAAERALTAGAPLPAERLQRLVGETRARGRVATRLAAWASVAGVEVDVEGPVAAPYAAM